MFRITDSWFYWNKASESGCNGQKLSHPTTTVSRGSHFCNERSASKSGDHPIVHCTERPIVEWFCMRKIASLSLSQQSWSANAARICFYPPAVSGFSGSRPLRDDDCFIHAVDASPPFCRQGCEIHGELALGCSPWRLRSVLGSPRRNRTQYSWRV